MPYKLKSVQIIAVQPYQLIIQFQILLITLIIYLIILLGYYQIFKLQTDRWVLKRFQSRIVAGQALMYNKNLIFLVFKFGRIKTLN